ncbi:MAG: hypothetical protein QNJ16_16745 [Rhodobacter sp.]|nr:hypothetical protein [Rhodobacter sp.]
MFARAPTFAVSALAEEEAYCATAGTYVPEGNRVVWQCEDQDISAWTSDPFLPAQLVVDRGKLAVGLNEPNLDWGINVGEPEVSRLFWLCGTRASSGERRSADVWAGFLVLTLLAS